MSLCLAVYNMIISHKRKDNMMFMIKNNSFVIAIGSIMSLERAMLGTFGVINDAYNMKIEAGTGALLLVLVL